MKAQKTISGARRRPRSLGFTLVEVVIALAILTVALFGMISVITFSTRMNQATKERMFAMRAAEQKIEQMLSCGSFDKIFTEFSKQTAGLGWDEVKETELGGTTRVVLAPVSPPATTVPTGFTYNNPDAKAVVFVRFPLDAAGDLTEVGTGQFMDNYDLDMTLPAPHKKFKDLDLNGKNGNADTSSSVVPLILSEIKLLPVIIDVQWRGTVGPKSGNLGNTYLTYRYTFFRKP